MSTNVHVEFDGYNFMTGGTEKLSLHLGKFSAGWVFLLKAHPEHNLHSLGDWQEVFPILTNAKIVDEWGEEMSWEEFKRQIMAYSNGERRGDNVRKTLTHDVAEWEFS